MGGRFAGHALSAMAGAVVGFMAMAVMSACGDDDVLRGEGGRMSGDCNKPKPMCFCKYCQYFEPVDGEKSVEGKCHRYPQTLEKFAINYCGEFAWRDENDMWSVRYVRD